MRWLLTFICILTWNYVACGQPEPPPDSNLDIKISIDDIQKERKSVEEDATLDDTVKKEILDIYQAAIDELAKLEAFQKAIQRFDQMIMNAPSNMEAETARRVSKVVPDSSAAFNGSMALADLEKIHAEALKELNASTSELERLSAEPKRRIDRLAEIPKLIRDLQTNLAELEKSPTVNGSMDPLLRARRTLKRIQKASWTASIKAMEKEKLSYEATEDLLRLQHEIMAAKSRDLNNRVQKLDKLVNERRKKEADQQARAETKRAKDESDPSIIEITQSIAELATERSKLADDMAQASFELQNVQTKLANVRKSYQRAKERVEAGGLSEAAGNVLLLERKQLPNVAEHKRNMQSRQETLGNVRFRLYELEDLAQTIAGSGMENHLELGKLQITKSFGWTRVQEMNDKYRDIINLLRDNHNSYYKTLLDLDDAEQDLISITEECSNYISEHVLWMRSMQPLGSQDFISMFRAKIWRSVPSQWMNAICVLISDIDGHWIIWSTGSIVFLIILFFQRRLRLHIGSVGTSVSKGAHAQFLPTLYTLACTILISIPWPLLMAFVGARLRASLSVSDFTNGLAGALTIVAWCWLPIEFMRQLLRHGGIAETHFDWPATSMRVIRTQIRWSRFIGLPLLFIVALATYQVSESIWSSSFGRVAFICLMFFLGHLLSRIFHPTKGAFYEWYAWNRDKWFYRLRHLWFTIAATGPAVMAILAITGYYETAQTIAVRLWATLCWTIGLIVLRALLARWVLMNRRRIALEQWRQRKQQAADNVQQTESSTPMATETETIDLAVVSSQTMQLIDTAILTLGIVLSWLIWIDVLPALGILRGVSAWPGAAKPTLADVLLSVATLIVMYLLARNIPGLLELSILEHLPLDSGARYAVSNLTRYTLVIVGLSIAGSFIGISWQSIQWLVAAVGIGLGFGLQEIFANFVSGIVLLFEQPLRVGDVVSLGNTTGVVSRIRIRATTIRDWDYKEYIVPNKDLVTGTLLNWTLTNQTNRIVITVGIAYGSDTDLARELLVKIANAH
ncbi:MAG: mechanosensitive ion channel, partial [Pirellulales bacterium]|nr:mechanosensitive ion channel [Pirellulales bacterium]